MTDANLSGDPGFRRAVAAVPVPSEQAIAVLGAASGAGWVGSVGEQTVVITDDPADAAGLVAGASGLNRAEPGVMIWSCVQVDGERSGGFLIARDGVVVGHDWTETPDDDAAIGEANDVVKVLGSEVEPYLLRALLRRTGDPEDLIVEALNLLELDTRLHTILVEGPPEGFEYVEPAGGFAAWRTVLKAIERPVWTTSYWWLLFPLGITASFFIRSVLAATAEPSRPDDAWAYLIFGLVCVLGTLCSWWTLRRWRRR